MMTFNRQMVQDATLLEWTPNKDPYIDLEMGFGVVLRITAREEHFIFETPRLNFTTTPQGLEAGFSVYWASMGQLDRNPGHLASKDAFLQALDDNFERAFSPHAWELLEWSLRQMLQEQSLPSDGAMELRWLYMEEEKTHDAEEIRALTTGSNTVFIPIARLKSVLDTLRHVDLYDGSFCQPSWHWPAIEGTSHERLRKLSPSYLKDLEKTLGL